MEDIALRLFKLADLEHKGFIGKRDMQRLQSEVGLLPEQLEAVFESLDACNNGYLTLDQFLAGIDSFKNGAYGSEIHGSGKAILHRTNSMEENEMVLQKMLSLKVLPKSNDSLQDMFSLIRSNGSEQLKQTWSQFLSCLYIDVSQLHKQLNELEERLRLREQQHQIQIGKLFEELESQVCEEREKLAKEGKKIESVLRSQLALELQEKDQQIADLIEQHTELFEKLSIVQAREQLIKEENARLIRGKEKYDAELENKKQTVSELKLNMERLKRDVVVEREKAFQEGFSHAQRLAIIEEEGLLHQLQLLREMQSTLLSGLEVGKRKPYLEFDNI